MVLPMGWVESPNFFSAVSDTLKNVTNAIVNIFLPVPRYGVIAKIPKTSMGLTNTLESSTHIDCYMDDIIKAV